MKKKIAFYSNKLDIGGIERATINYINLIDKDKYDITLFLEKNGGSFQNEIDKRVTIVNFNQSNHKNPFIRKLMNAWKMIVLRIKYYHKFDFAANFGTVVKSGAILAKCFSKNNAYWIHGHVWHSKEEADAFIKKYHVDKYQKIVFVSNRLKKIFQDYYPNNTKKLYVLNNPIDYQDVINKSNEKIRFKKERLTLLNVGRHFEQDKHLSMMIKVVNRLIKEKYDFELWLLGSGEDTLKYQGLVEENNIQDKVKFLGFSKNVYPFYKLCDALLLSSHFEGNPVVFLEAKIFKKPIITTDVSDAKEDLKDYGIVTDNNEEGFYLGLKRYLDDGYIVKKVFKVNEYNKDILKKLYRIIEEEV